MARHRDLNLMPVVRLNRWFAALSVRYILRLFCWTELKDVHEMRIRFCSECFLQCEFETPSSRRNLNCLKNDYADAKWLDVNRYVNFDGVITRKLTGEKNKTSQVVKLKLRLRYSCHKDLKRTRIMILAVDRPPMFATIKTSKKCFFSCNI